MKMTVVGYWGGYPGVSEATSGYLLEKDNFQLLVDCGSGVLAQVQKYVALESLDAVIISHYHHDHVADIGPLQFARHVLSFIKEDKPASLPIYGHHLDVNHYNQLTYHNATHGVAYNTGNPLEIGPFSLKFIETKHPVPCMAMRISDDHSEIVYTADTSYFDELIPFSHHADLLIAESSLYKGQEGQVMGHMNSEDVSRLAQLAEVKELLLTHLPHYGEHKALIKEASELYKGKVSLAESGWTWVL